MFVSEVSVNMAVLNRQILSILSSFLTLFDLLEEEDLNTVDERQMFFALSYLKKERVHRQRLKGYVEEVIPSYNDRQFQSHFRMRRATFNFILNLIRPAIRRIRYGRETIPPEKQLLITLWRMATPDSYRSICEKFDVGRGSALRAVRRVTKAIFNLAPLFIKWPERDRVRENFVGFNTLSPFPKVLGAIDSTHINIKAPRENPQAYVNRKQHHSVHLQGICDHERKFIYCYAGQVGSVHDQRVFRLSSAYEYLQEPEKFPEDCHLVGDAAYTIHNHLMTPYRDNGQLTHQQRHYNYIHSTARIVIERTFALLKGRFRSLLTLLDMNRVDLIPQYIIACCVLHNICIMQNDELDNLNIHPIENVHQILNVYRRPLNNGAHAKRDNICLELNR
ncbi:hypothetical protein FQR65_LT14457 [Abscondita terminalis]|nr:hypothetical protein FQR65_LT14457 [Abscondita terminalis]